MASLVEAWARRGTARGVLDATATVAVLSLVVKAGTALRELLIAWYFGTGDALDAYLIAYAVPYFLITIIGAALPGVLIPTYVQLRIQRGSSDATRLLNATLGWTTLLLVLVAVVLAVAAPLYLPLIGSGFTPEKLRLTAALALLLAPTILTSSLISLLGGSLNAHQRFVVPALSPLVTTLVAIGALVAFGGIFALAAGTLLGTLLELAVLVLALRSIGVAVRLRFERFTSELSDLVARLGPTIIGSLLMASTLLVDQAMTSPLQPGSVAALNYATRVVTFPLGLSAAALGTVALPRFAELVSRLAWMEVQQLLRRYLQVIMLFSCPIAAGLVLFSGPLTETLFARGAFFSTQVPTVAATISALALQIPFYTGVIILMRVALALRLNLAIAVISLVNVGVNVALNAWLASFMGVTGIALSTSCVYICSFALLYLVVSSRLSSRLLS